MSQNFEDEKEDSSLIPLKTGVEFESDELFGEVPHVSLTWENLCYSTKNNNTKNSSNNNNNNSTTTTTTNTRTTTSKTKDILSNISGYLPSGKILAIIGPSGAGKTTLLQILSGCLIATSGNLYYNGRIKQNTCEDGFNNDIMGYNGNAAFITQDLTLHGSLTVRETLYFASQLKCKQQENYNREYLNRRVDILLEYLGLTHCQDTMIGNVFIKGISGGEKKRVSLGCELVTQTSLLFLDEPTSGLDATATNTLLFMLHKLTLLGHSIIITIHQPSSSIFDLLSVWEDYLMILEHGQLEYFGLCNKSISFFDSIGYHIPKYTNPFEYFLNAVNSDFINFNRNNKIDVNPKYIHNQFNKLLLPNIVSKINEINNHCIESNVQTYSNTPNSFCTQIYVLFKRNILHSLRSPALYLIRFFMFVNLGLGYGLLCFGVGTEDHDVLDRVLILFSLEAYVCFLSVAAAATFAEERVIFIRERMNSHYTTLPYIIAAFLSRQPFLFSLSFSSVLPTVLLTEYDSNLDFEFLCIYVLAIYAVLAVGESLMCMLSGLFKKSSMSLVVGSGLHGLLVCTNGMLRPHDQPWPFKPFKWISLHTYGFRILVKNEFRDMNFDNDNDRYTRGADVLEQYDMENGNILTDFIVLAGMVVICEFGFFMVLKFLNRVAY